MGIAIDLWESLVTNDGIYQNQPIPPVAIINSYVMIGTIEGLWSHPVLVAGSMDRRTSYLAPCPDVNMGGE